MIEDRLDCGLWPLLLGCFYTARLLLLISPPGHHRASRANGPGHIRSAGRGSGPWPARPPDRAARSLQSADRAGPAIGPFLRAMGRAADRGPYGHLYVNGELNLLLFFKKIEPATGHNSLYVIWKNNVTQ
jgi:hypothetical protein